MSYGAGSTADVTGAAGGVGRPLADRLAPEAFRVDGAGPPPAGAPGGEGLRRGGPDAVAAANLALGRLDEASHQPQRRGLAAT